MLMGNGPSKISMPHAALIQMVAKIVNVILQLAITMVLARLLTPEEYGTIAIIAVFTGLFSCLSDFGISSAIVQFKGIDRRDCGALLFLSLIIGIVMSIIFLCVSYGISLIYNDPVFVPLGCVLMFAVIFNSMNMVPNGLLLRDRRFIVIGFRSVIVYLISGLIAIVLAFYGLGVYALAMNSVMSAFFLFLWNSIAAKVWIRFDNFIPILKQIAKFSGFQYGHQIVSYLSGYIDTLVIGRYFGASALGYYNKATTLSMMPIEYVTVPISSTMQPYLAEKQDDHDGMYFALSKIAKTVILLSVPCGFLLSLCSSELIPLLFGDNWRPAIPVLQILAIAIAFRAINWVHGSVLISSARTGLLMLSTSSNAVCVIIASAVGVCLGSLTSMAFAVAIAYFIELMVCTFICIKLCLGHSIGHYILLLLPECIAGTLAFVITGLIFSNVGLNIFLLLITKAFVYILLYLVFCILMGQKRFMVEALRALR